MRECRRRPPSAPAGEQRRECRPQDVLRTRTPEAGEEPAEDSGQHLDLQVRAVLSTREQVERRRIGLVTEIEEDDVADARAGDPLQECVHEIALGFEQREAESSVDPFDGEVEK